MESKCYEYSPCSDCFIQPISGKCGACWAFASIGVLETSYATLVGKRKQFSEQELVDCTYDVSFMGDIDKSLVSRFARMMCLSWVISTRV